MLQRLFMTRCSVPLRVKISQVQVPMRINRAPRSKHPTIRKLSNKLIGLGSEANIRYRQKITLGQGHTRLAKGNRVLLTRQMALVHRRGMISFRMSKLMSRSYQTPDQVPIVLTMALQELLAR